MKKDIKKELMDDLRSYIDSHSCDNELFDLVIRVEDLINEEVEKINSVLMVMNTIIKVTR